jgi:magnesium-transporting ATPase (P-type)
MKPQDEDGGEDEDVMRKRVWYMPWKVREERSSSRVPSEWLETDMQRGLSNSEAQTRLKRVGPNELTSKKENQFTKVLGYFRGPILYCMELAVLLAGGLQDWVDFGVIIGILVSYSICIRFRPAFTRILHYRHSMRSWGGTRRSRPVISLRSLRQASLLRRSSFATDRSKRLKPVSASPVTL